MDNKLFSLIKERDELISLTEAEINKFNEQISLLSKQIYCNKWKINPAIWQVIYEETVDWTLITMEEYPKYAIVETFIKDGQLGYNKGSLKNNRYFYPIDDRFKADRFYLIYNADIKNKATKDVITNLFELRDNREYFIRIGAALSRGRKIKQEQK